MNRDSEFMSTVIDPACAWLSRESGRDMGNDRARVLMLAIAVHESGLIHRRQLGSGGRPLKSLARGFWQFENKGGVLGVLMNKASRSMAKAACAAAFVPANRADIHEAIAWHDRLAAVFARLLLWTDPRPLPAVGDQAGAWDYYLRNWRPGKPRALDWPNSYGRALAVVRGEE